MLVREKINRKQKILGSPPPPAILKNGALELNETHRYLNKLVIDLLVLRKVS